MKLFVTFLFALCFFSNVAQATVPCESVVNYELGKLGMGTVSSPSTGVEKIEKPDILNQSLEFHRTVNSTYQVVFTSPFLVNLRRIHSQQTNESSRIQTEIVLTENCKIESINSAQDGVGIHATAAACRALKSGEVTPSARKEKVQALCVEYHEFLAE